MSFLDKIAQALGYQKQEEPTQNVTKIEFTKEQAPEILAKAYAMISTDPEALNDAAEKAAKQLMPLELAKAIPFDDKDKINHENFVFDEFDDRLMLEQLYSSDIRPSGITNDTIRRLGFKSTLVSAIVQRRVWQVQSFAGHQKDRYELGFSIEPRSGETPTLRQKEDIKNLVEMLDNLGYIGYDPIRGSFKDFLRLTIQDSLLFDGMTLEKIHSKSGVPVAFKAIDGGSIHPRFDKDTREFVYDEKINGVTVNTYTANNVTYYVRNKTTDRRWLGYGISEVERLINTITSHLFAEEYNKRLFKSGHFLNGVISLKGNISRSQFQEFKRDFYSFVTGVENTNRVAIVNAPQGIEFNNAIRSPNEMGFTTFMDYLVKVASAVFMMDPVEINFFVTGGANNQGSQNINLSSQEFRLKYSKDAGLRPLLDCEADFLNRSIIWPLTDGEYEIKFRGLDEDDKKTRQEYVVKAKKYLTINEVRALEGYPPLDDPDLGAVIEDSGYVQIMNSKLQQKQAENQGGDDTPNGPGEGPSQDQAEIIQGYMRDNGYDEDSIATVLDAFNSGSISFEDFKEYAGITDEDLEAYIKSPDSEPANHDEDSNPENEEASEAE